MCKFARQSKICQQLLQNVAHRCLGVAKNKRHAFQEEACSIIGAELGALKQPLEKRIHELELNITTGDKELETLLHQQREAEQRATAIQAQIMDWQTTVDAVKGEQQKTLSILNSAQLEKKHAMSALQEAAAMKRRCEDIFHSEFVPLRDDESLSKSQARDHVEQVCVFMQSFSCEGALLSSFQHAGSHPPSERGIMCVESMRAMEEHLTQLLQDASDVYSGCSQTLASCSSKTEDAHRDYTLKGNDVEHANSQLKSLHETLTAAMQEVQQIQSAVLTLRQAIRAMQDERAQLLSELDNVFSPCWQSYEWLLTHSFYGYKVPGLQDDSEKKYSGVVYDRMSILCKCIRDLNCPEVCGDMLAACVRDGLGPLPSERGPPQHQANELLGKVFGSVHRQLQQAVVDLIPPVGKTNVEGRLHCSLEQCLTAAGNPQDSRESAIGVATEIVKEKELAKANAEFRAHETQEALDKADVNIDCAQRKLSKARDVLFQFDVRYQSFLDLKSGKNLHNPVFDQTVNDLQSWFVSWGFEDCLMGGFSPAARQHPNERGSWCCEVIEEVERQLLAKKAQLEDQCRACENDVEACLRSKRQAQDALIEPLHASEVVAARALLLKVEELDMFTCGRLFPYMWLLKRPNLEEWNRIEQCHNTVV